MKNVNEFLKENFDNNIVLGSNINNNILFIFLESGDILDFNLITVNEQTLEKVFKSLKEYLKKDYHYSELYIINRMINKFLEELTNPYSPRIRNFKLSNISIKDRLLSLFMRNSMPYGISEIDTNKGKRLFFINREYKPIGFFGYNDFVFYENAVKERSFYYINEFSRIYFYDEQTTPWDNKYNLFLYLFLLIH